ncbi:MAG: hypothetical protein F6J93_23385 [Oscillatoria sp. SIO1A7]|nr:hypothetical protein [Oscillatoria sp. SIO1A7]
MLFSDRFRESEVSTLKKFRVSIRNQSAQVIKTSKTPQSQHPSLHPEKTGFLIYRTLHPTPYTPHPTPQTLHPTPHTLHPLPTTAGRSPLR